MLAWGKWRANHAFLTGDLIQSAAFLKSICNQQCATDRRLARKLTRALIDRASRGTARPDPDPDSIHQAWCDLSSASEIALPEDQDLLSKEKTHLVDLTVHAADACLVGGHVVAAIQLVHELDSRDILDWRADRIGKAARLIQNSDELALRGALVQSKERLLQAENLRPDLAVLDSRKKAAEHRELHVKQLTKKLETALLQVDWQQVENFAGQLLEIAPNYQIAIDARNRLLEQQFTCPKPKTVYQANPITVYEPLVKADQVTGRVPKNQLSFLVWIDSVGGFFVCPSKKNYIGSAVPSSHVEIPMAGDLCRRHARFDRVSGGHVLVPFGKLTVDDVSCKTQVPLKSGQIIKFDGGVSLRYMQTHPLSSSALLGYASRHRTQPWSDGIILCSGSVLIGPDPRNHIMCPRWSSNLIIFWREDKWFCRTQGKFLVDDKTVNGEAEIKMDSRIVGADFSMSLEPIG